MFAIYKNMVRTMVVVGFYALSCVVFSSSVQAMPSNPALMNEAACNSSGECAMDISGMAKNIFLACESSKVSVSWNHRRQGSFLIACDCECTSHDNIGWLVDLPPIAGTKKIQKLYLGKRVTVELLKKAPRRISDIFSSHPLCEKIDTEKLKSSVFVSLIKQPENSEVAPYCFSPVYVIGNKKTLEARTNNVNNGYGELLYLEEENPILDAELLRVIDGLLR